MLLINSSIQINLLPVSLLSLLRQLEMQHFARQSRLQQPPKLDSLEVLFNFLRLSDGSLARTSAYRTAYRTDLLITELTINFRGTISAAGGSAPAGCSQRCALHKFAGLRPKQHSVLDGWKRHRGVIVAKAWPGRPRGTNVGDSFSSQLRSIAGLTIAIRKPQPVGQQLSQAG